MAEDNSRYCLLQVCFVSVYYFSFFFLFICFRFGLLGGGAFLFGPFQKLLIVIFEHYLCRKMVALRLLLHIKITNGIVYLSLIHESCNIKFKFTFQYTYWQNIFFSDCTINQQSFCSITCLLQANKKYGILEIILFPLANITQGIRKIQHLEGTNHLSPLVYFILI